MSHQRPHQLNGSNNQPKLDDAAEDAFGTLNPANLTGNEVRLLILSSLKFAFLKRAGRKSS
jgi:hypothetical protein